jgi:formate/nitrite transporter FocA (FNT family)
MKQTQLAGLLVLLMGVLYVLLAAQTEGVLALLGNLVGGFLFFLGLLAQVYKPKG